MADPNPTNPPAAKAAMTKAEAAKAVRRTVTDKDGKVSKVAVKEAEVFDFRDFGTHVVVVTVDGQKFSSADA